LRKGFQVIPKDCAGKLALEAVGRSSMGKIGPVEVKKRQKMGDLSHVAVYIKS